MKFWGNMFPCSRNEGILKQISKGQLTKVNSKNSPFSKDKELIVDLWKVSMFLKSLEIDL